MAARRADERRTRPIIRALEAGCGWLEEPVPLSVGREGAWPGGQGLGRGQEGRFPDARPSAARWVWDWSPSALGRVGAAPASGRGPAGSASGGGVGPVLMAGD